VVGVVAQISRFVNGKRICHSLALFSGRLPSIVREFLHGRRRGREESEIGQCELLPCGKAVVKRHLLDDVLSRPVDGVEVLDGFRELGESGDQELAFRRGEHFREPLLAVRGFLPSVEGGD